MSAEMPNFNQIARDINAVRASLQPREKDPYSLPEQITAVAERKKLAVMGFGQFCLDAISDPDVTPWILRVSEPKEVKGNSIAMMSYNLLDQHQPLIPAYFYLTEGFEPMLLVRVSYKSGSAYTYHEEQRAQEAVILTNYPVAEASDWSFRHEDTDVNLHQMRVIGRRRFDPQDLLADDVFFFAFARGVASKFRQIQEGIHTERRAEKDTADKTRRAEQIAEMVERANKVFEEGFASLNQYPN